MTLFSGAVIATNVGVLSALERFQGSNSFFFFVNFVLFAVLKIFLGFKLV